jgi:hypothetical protein
MFNCAARRYRLCISLVQGLYPRLFQENVACRTQVFMGPGWLPMLCKECMAQRQNFVNFASHLMHACADILQNV